MARPLSTPAPLSLLLVLSGCVGDVGAPGGAGAGIVPGAQPGGSALPGVGVGVGPVGVDDRGATVGTQTSALCASGHRVGAAHFEHLTRAEYVRAVQDLTGVSVPADAVPGDDTTQGFSLGVSSSPLLADAYASSAEQIAAKADVATLSGCGRDAAEACSQDFIAGFARRAFRRPVSDDERSGLSALFAAGKADGDAASGVRLAIEAVLASPSFLYHVDETQGADATGLAPLTPHALASRLAFLIWGSVPDAALLDAADRAELSEPAQIERTVTRMLGERAESARAGFQRFYSEWLWLDQLDHLSKEPVSYPEFSPTLRDDLRRSFVQQIDGAAWADGAPLTDVLRGSTGFVNAALAPLFGVQASGTALTQVALDPRQRLGMLTHPALLSLLAKPNQSAPVIRGKFVREQLLCMKLPPPPPDVVTSAPDPAPGLSTRQRFAEHSREPACAGCHSLMDPIGFGLEHFDALGKFRNDDGGKPVDARGQILGGSDVDGEFDGAVMLAERLANSSDVRDCIATHYFRFAVRRTEAADDTCSLAGVRDSLVTGSADLPQLIAAIARSDAFRYRTP